MRRHVDSSLSQAGYAQSNNFAPVPSFASTARPMSSGSVWRTRMHRLYLRLNALELLVVQLLRALFLWPALMQPPHTDDMREELEQAATLLAKPQKQPQQDASAPWRWSASLLATASAALFPNGWHPLSFRKTIVIEESLEPTYPAASTTNQNVACLLLVLLILLLNTAVLQ